MADNAIIFKGSQRCEPFEAEAGGTVTPGMLVEHDSANDLVAHATTGGPSARAFADLDVDPDDGKDDDYADGDQARAFYAAPGVEVDALLAASQTIAIGDFLVSNGDGYLIEYSAASHDAGAVVGQAVEAVTTGTGATDRVHLRVV